MDTRQDEIMKGKPEEVVGSLLTIGDELLLGDIPNGNAHHIACELRSRGFRLDRIITIGDREEEIAEVLSRCPGGCRFVIVTGGLGPTDDDRTCAAVSRAFNLPLATNPIFLNQLKRLVKKFGIPWSEHIARMALLPEGAVKLGGSMAGFSLEYGKMPCYFLPGVPREMKTLLSELVIPDLEERFPRRLSYTKRVLRVQRLTESEINHLLKDLDLREKGIEIGYLPQTGENWVTLLAAAETQDAVRSRLAEAEEKVLSRIGSQNVSGYDDECIEKVIGRQLRERGWKLSVAESCTGGLLSRRITAIAGASDYFDRAFVTYSNQAKEELLKVPVELLRIHGAVSKPVAEAMVSGVRSLAHADVSLAITGIAGPGGGSEEKPVGAVFIACATPDRIVTEEHLFRGDRERIQESAAQAALVLLWRTLSNDQNVHSH
ncbi:MAG: CinA family nicotinamide mononucleotide deamidase-related protein [Syntrophobacteraceae bacterium]